MNLDLRLFSEIEQELVKMLEQRAAELMSGKSSSWEDYKYRTGYIKALRDALSVAMEAQKNVLGVTREEER